MEKKYKLTNETIVINGKTLYRIEALIDFSNVHKGEKGGFVEKENNLSQIGDCWIKDNAKVYDNAVVYCNAKVYGNAEVSDNAEVSNNAEVYGYAKVFGSAEVYGNARVYGNAKVYDDVEVYGNAKVYDDAKVYGYTKVYDDAEVYGNAEVYDNAKVYGNAIICGAVISSDSDYIVFKNWWSSGRYFTWTRSNNMWKVGCFYGTGKELIKKAYKDSEISGREYERVVKYVESILADNS